MAHTSFRSAAMIDSQIRPNKVIDERVVAAFAQTPREEFVPKALRDVAYVDEDLTLSGGRYLVEAMVMGRLLQALDLKAGICAVDRRGNRIYRRLAVSTLCVCDCD